MKFITLTLNLFFVFLFFPAFTSASASGLVIDEFRTRGTTAYDEYIVLANYGFGTVNIENYWLYKLTSSGSTKYTLLRFPAYTLNPQQRIVIAGTAYSGEKDFSYSSNSLADSNNAIVIQDPANNIIDSVTYGTVSFPKQESPALANPESGIAYKRVNGKDTDNNLNDFALQKETITFDPSAYRIMLTEMMPDPKSGDEWFEIYNPLGISVSLAGLTVCDKMGATHCYGLTGAITPFGYIVFEQTKTKITFNNDGDILEIRSPNGNIVSSSLTSYGKATEDYAYGYFGQGWKWTKTATKGSANILSIPAPSPTAAKTTKSTSSKSKKSSLSSKSKTPSYTTLTEDNTTEANEVESSEDVKGTESESKITKKQAGIALIILAIATVIGYTIYENREKLHDLYDKIIRRNN